MHYSFLFLILTSLVVISEDDSNICSTKMLQIMKPSHPDTSYQGFAVVRFDINSKGNTQNIKAISSECAVGRDDKEKIILKKCPFFKASAVNAAKYIKFNPPKDSNGNSCEILNRTYEYKFSLYNIKLEYDDFLIRDDFREKQSKFLDEDGRIFQGGFRQDPPPLTEKASAIENAQP